MPHFKPLIFWITLPLIASLLTGCGDEGGGTNIVPETEIIISPVFDILPFIPTPPYEAHQLAVNEPSAWEQGFSGQGTVIAVIDSGINLNHVDFIDRSGTQLIDDINATGFKFNTLNNTVYQVDDYRDTDGHGIYVSSIASGQAYGIAPSSAILPIKVFFDAPSIDSRVIDTALPYATTRSDIIKTGQLAQTQVASATIGQSLLGVRHQLDTQTQIGIQAYRALGITSANMTLTVPVGMDSNGTVQTETIQHKESLLPNTLELYYRVNPLKNLNYSLNAITREHDSSFGITLTQRF